MNRKVYCFCNSGTEIRVYFSSMQEIFPLWYFCNFFRFNGLLDVQSNFCRSIRNNASGRKAEGNGCKQQRKQGFFHGKKFFPFLLYYF